MDLVKDFMVRVPSSAPVMPTKCHQTPHLAEKRERNKSNGCPEGFCFVCEEMIHGSLRNLKNHLRIHDMDKCAKCQRYILGSSCGRHQRRCKVEIFVVNREKKVKTYSRKDRSKRSEAGEADAAGEAGEAADGVASRDHVLAVQLQGQEDRSNVSEAGEAADGVSSRDHVLAMQLQRQEDRSTSGITP